MSEPAVVCPFCPLACDDLIASESIIDAKDVSHWLGCDHSKRQFKIALTRSRVRIGSDHLERHDWARIRQTISGSTTPVIEIHGATIAESKCLEDLLSQGRIRIRAAHDPSIAAVQDLVARDGVMAATLGEVCSRSDLIWCLGDLRAMTPRLPDQLTQSGVEMMVTPQLTIADISRLNQLLAATTEEPHVASTELDSYFVSFQNKTNLAIVVGQSAFEANNETAVAEMLFRLISRWNDRGMRGSPDSPDLKSRMRLLAMTPDQSFAAVNRWRNNRSLRYTEGAEDDAIFRVGNASGQPISHVRVQIGGEDGGESGSDVYLPAAIAGVHFSDTTIRGDGSVTLPLLGRTRSVLPSRMDVLRQLIGV